MNTKNSKLRRWMRRIIGLTTVFVMTLSVAGQASARILFEDDDFFKVNSEGIILDTNNDVGSTATNISLQFGNDGTDASIDYAGDTGDVTLSTPGGDFSFSDDNITTTGTTSTSGLTATGAVDFSGATRMALDQGASNPGTCTEGDIHYNTTDNTTYICTATNTWTALSSGSSDFESVYGADAGNNLVTSNGVFSIDTGTAALNFDSGNPSSWQLNSDGAADDLTIEVTGATDSSLVLSSSGTGADAIDINATAGNIDIDATSDNGITIDATESSNFSVATDAAAEDLTIAVTGATDSSVVVNSSGTGADAIDLNATAGGITIDATGAWSIQGAGNSDITTTGANDISIIAGDDLIFDDAQLIGTVQLTVTATDFDATFSSDGIIDNLNSFASTSAGEGASNVGIQDASTWFTGAEIEAALNEIEALFGSTTSSTYNFGEDNVLVDNDAVYAALNKLDLKWGDLASTANGEGASLVGIEDSGGLITATTVEGALAELAGDLANNYADLTFFPEYPDTVVHADGTTNKGTLESFYDDTEDSNYYNWTTNQTATQDIDLRFQFPLPTDFSTTGDFTFRYRTGTVTEADNDVEVSLFNVTNTATCASDTTNGTAGTWATGTITAASINAGCTAGTVLDAGDIVEVQIKLLDNSGAGDYADIGRIDWEYTK